MDILEDEEPCPIPYTEQGNVIIEKDAGVKEVLTDEGQITEYVAAQVLEEKMKNLERIKEAGHAGGYDLVIVDAECTHDGSVKHIEKYKSKWGMEQLDKKMPWCESPE